MYFSLFCNYLPLEMSVALHYMTNMTTLKHKNPMHGDHEIYNLVKPSLHITQFLALYRRRSEGFEKKIHSMWGEAKR